MYPLKICAYEQNSEKRYLESEILCFDEPQLYHDSLTARLRDKQCLLHLLKGNSVTPHFFLARNTGDQLDIESVSVVCHFHCKDASLHLSSVKTRPKIAFGGHNTCLSLRYLITEHITVGF